MPADLFDQTKSALLALGSHRVWSLMVTLFGDLAQAEGSTIDGPTLSAVMTEMDIRPEAVRVALHRLRNDGWISSQKTGRTGQHCLTPLGRSETRQASARIYASATSPHEGWKLVLTQDADTPQHLTTQGLLPLLPRIYLGGTQAKVPPMALVLTGNDAPEWLRSQIAPLMLEADYAALLPALGQVEQMMQIDMLTPLQTATLRCLLVHNWRRIVLRHPPLPHALLPENWSGHACHLLIETLLTRFPRPAINTILPARVSRTSPPLPRPL
ncbi:PaaX family transcriptional regulator C-terminal domain-containing protein [uncultured Sulfitobacter sp.]|uniref:PaaX family transcriptional regulator C-terminal domain-containing protein n=1 Tax=uncultured Sulfitobacter sp. TaxID=191468 RepID=UPI002620EE73|nr:PaaX family transcriptional regulator C-terminal domain-containing protein [uncultured Sulfitobacter sp.]